MKQIIIHNFSGFKRNEIFIKSCLFLFNYNMTEISVKLRNIQKLKASIRWTCFSKQFQKFTKKFNYLKKEYMPLLKSLLHSYSFLYSHACSSWWYVISQCHWVFETICHVSIQQSHRLFWYFQISPGSFILIFLQQLILINVTFQILPNSFELSKNFFIINCKFRVWKKMYQKPLM